MSKEEERKPYLCPACTGKLEFDFMEMEPIYTNYHYICPNKDCLTNSLIIEVKNSDN